MTERGMNLNRGVGTADIGAFADSLAESLNRQMRAAFQPEERKSLRRFSSTEVAELLRVSPRMEAFPRSSRTDVGTATILPKRSTPCATYLPGQERMQTHTCRAAGTATGCKSSPL